MRVLRACKMISLDNIYEGKSRVLLGFFLMASCVPLVRTTNYSSLEATTSKLMVGDRLVSTPNPYFEFGIFPHEYLGVATPSYYLSIRYAPPIDEVVIWVSNRSTPLSSAAVLLFHPNGFLELSDQNQNTQRVNIWNTFTNNLSLQKDVVSAQLLDTGKLVLKDQNGTEVWNSFDNSSPTDTLLPGQYTNRRYGQSLVSRRGDGSPDWAGNSALYNLGYPTEALHGTDRISYSRNQTVQAAKKDKNLMKIVMLAVGIPIIVLLIVVAIFCLWRYEKFRQWLRACGRCGSCCMKPKPRYEIKFPGDIPVRDEPGNGGVEPEVEEQRPALCCTCTIRCYVSCNCFGSPRI